MLSLSKKTDYALIAMCHLAQRPERIAPAREIAMAYNLPLPLLMNILKELHQHGMVTSVRGTKGGYRIAINPAAVSLYQLIEVVDGPVHMTECAGSPGTGTGTSRDLEDCRVSELCPVQGPMRVLHQRLVKLLKEVKLAELLTPGHASDNGKEVSGSGAMA